MGLETSFNPRRYLSVCPGAAPVLSGAPNPHHRPQVSLPPLSAGASVAEKKVIVSVQPTAFPSRRRRLFSSQDEPFHPASSACAPASLGLWQHPSAYPAVCVRVPHPAPSTCRNQPSKAALKDTQILAVGLCPHFSSSSER